MTDYNLPLSGIFHGFVKWGVASMTFFTAHSLVLIWDASRLRCLSDFEHSGSSIMSHMRSMLHSSQIYQAVHLEHRTYIFNIEHIFITFKNI